MEPLDPLDIIERAFDRSGADNDGDDELYRWIDPVYMDGVENLPDSLAESHDQAKGINVKQVLSEEVGVDTRDHDSGDSGNDSIYSRLYCFNTYGSIDCV